VRWDSAFDESANSMRTSLPMHSSEDRLQVYAIFESECLKSDDVIGQEITISDYIARPCMIPHKQTGELITAIRVLFLRPGALPVAFVSRAAVDFIRDTANLKDGGPAWEPPITVRVKQSPCRGGRTFKFLPVKPARK